jgi:drug/metabolite transporter (DMT)-like permease
VIKTAVLVLIAGLLGGAGHVLLAKGMKTIGDLTEAPAALVGGMVGRTLSNPWVLLGVALQAGFFFMYLTLLSRADVSKILPMTAFDYIVIALLAQLFLAEPVTPARWSGIGFIVLGVFLVSRT